MVGRRLIVAFIASVALLSSPNGQAASNETNPETLLTKTTTEWKSLSGNAKKRQFRDRWEKVIAQFEAIGRTRASGEIRATALLRAGAAAEEMHRISRLPKDLARAESLYREASKFKTPSAQDASERLKVLAKVEATPKKDVAPPPTVEKAETKTVEAPKTVDAKNPPELVAATQAWRKLQRDPDRHGKRQSWLDVIASLEAVGEEHAPTEAGALGFFRAARAAEELYKYSEDLADARRAIELFERVPDRCPATFLNDDALIAAAEIEWQMLREADAARAHLIRAIELKGDSTEDAQALLAQLLPMASEPLVGPPEEAKPLEVADVKPAPIEKTPEPKAAPAKLTEAAKPELERLGQLLKTDSELSLADEVGLKVKRIVIDAGHGGKDVGAIGPSGVQEKDVTLAISKKLAETLRARGYEVVLTREDDTYVGLEERAQFANRERGDLFISIHANAHPSAKQSGIETYTLNVASNRFSRRLAARENATSTATVSDVQFLLADLATRSNTVDSDRLATRVQSSLIEGVAKKFTRPKDHGVKHALFYVLLGAKMPAVLIETAFLSNKTEEKRLASPAYQSTIADSIAKGVDQFVERRRHLAVAD